MKFLAMLFVAITAACMIAVGIADTTNVMAPDEGLRQQFEKTTQLHLKQLASQDEAALRQKLWESQEYVGSPNVIAKVTVMISPLNAKGQIVEMNVLTYYWQGKMRYATGVVDKVKEK